MACHADQNGIAAVRILQKRLSARCQGVTFLRQQSRRSQTGNLQRLAPLGEDLFRLQAVVTGLLVEGLCRNAELIRAQNGNRFYSYRSLEEGMQQPGNFSLEGAV